MLESILIGSGFAFVAAVQPGPLQAYLLSSVSQHGWKRTLPASCSPLLSDGPIALFVLLLLNHISPAMYGFLQAAGGFLLLYFAWMSYRQWKRKTVIETEKDGLMPRTLFQAAMVNILNPNPYLGWSLVLGPACLSAWKRSPLNALMLILAFYTTMVSVLAATIFLLGTTRFLSQVGRRILILASVIILAAMGIYLIVASVFRATTI
jgi:threonine/homoserine/homoserine lactone efflux protein